MSLDKCIHPCNHHSQDLEYFHRPKELPVPFPGSPHQHPWTTTDLPSITMD